MKIFLLILLIVLWVPDSLPRRLIYQLSLNDFSMEFHISVLTLILYFCFVPSSVVPTIFFESLTNLHVVRFLSLCSANSLHIRTCSSYSNLLVAFFSCWKCTCVVDAPDQSIGVIGRRNSPMKCGELFKCKLRAFKIFYHSYF